MARTAFHLRFHMPAFIPLIYLHLFIFFIASIQWFPCHFRLRAVFSARDQNLFPSLNLAPVQTNQICGSLRGYRLDFNKAPWLRRARLSSTTHAQHSLALLWFRGLLINWYQLISRAFMRGEGDIIVHFIGWLKRDLIISASLFQSVIPQLFTLPITHYTTNSHRLNWIRGLGGARRLAV